MSIDTKTLVIEHCALMRWKLKNNFLAMENKRPSSIALEEARKVQKPISSFFSSTKEPLLKWLTAAEGSILYSQPHTFVFHDKIAAFDFG